MSAALYPYELPWLPPERRAPRRGLLLGLGGAAGPGWGDAAPWPGFSPSRLEGVERELRAALPWLAIFRPSSVDEIRREVASLGPEARAAAELALLDRYGHATGLSVAELLADSPAPRALVSAVGVGEPQQAARAVADGARVLKVKIGAAAPELDLERLRRIRAAVGAQVELRVDANGAWHDAAAAAAARLEALRAIDVAWLEQPWRAGGAAAADDVAAAWLAPDALEADAAARFSWLGRGVAIAADESVALAAAGGATAAETLARLAGVDVLVLKPMFLGGPAASVALGRAALAAGLSVCVSNAWESAVGRAGALHAAAALAVLGAPGLRAPGLDAPLSADVAELMVTGGTLTLPVGPGLGITPRLGAGSAP